jgi:ABC-2 type transport system permease protein
MWKAEWIRLKAEWDFYRSMLIGQFLNQLLVSLGTFWVVSLLGERNLSTLMGLLFWQYVSIPFSKISTDIWEDVSSGAFDQIYLSTRSPVRVLLIRLIIYMLRQTVVVLPVFFVMALVFGFSYQELIGYPWIGFLVSFVLTLVGLIGLGLMVGGVLLVSRNAISYASAVEYGLLFFSGVIVPFQEMPFILKIIAPWLPLSLGVEILRRVEANLAYSNLVFLLLIQSLVLLLLGFVLFQKCLKKGLKRGFAMGR